MILEIRAGIGGEEGALFAADLLRMYTMYAERRGWTLSIVSENMTELGGVKEVSAEIEGAGAWSRLKFEAGTHRVQRVPESILFCVALKAVSGIYGKYLKNPYLRVCVAGCLVIGITMLLGTGDYMGAGNELIARAVEQGKARPLDFLWKMILTAITMRAGYRGGEIVPAFSVGATFGCVAGGLLGFSPEVAAAASMVALFCGVTNCPIASMLISFELFGFSGAAYYLIAISISYALSGYYSLYKDQTIVYSKYKARYINKKTH